MTGHPLIKRVLSPLFLIFIVALILRLYALSSIPVGLHGDEASIGYNAYSILKTARSQDGKFLPLSFDQFGDFRAGGYHYIDIPFVAVFGLTPLAIRLPSALFGALTIIVFYLLVYELFNNKTIALVSSLLLATLPWHINISRASSEGIIASFFVLLGTYLLLKELKKNQLTNRGLFYSFLSLLTSFFFYHSARFFIPVFLPFFFICVFLTYHPTKKNVTKTIIFSLAVLAGFIFFLIAGSGGGRVSQVSLLNIPGGTKEIKQQTDEDGTQNPLLTRFFHNKLFFYSRLFLTFYSQHLSGDFLFVNNGSPIRYRLLWTGNLYLVQAPFLLFGLAILLAEGIKQKKYLYLIPLFWLVIGALPAALTWEDLPNVVRANLMIPALMMIVSFGFYEAVLLTKGTVRQVLMVVCALALVQNGAQFLHNYFYHAKIHEPWHRSASEPDLIYSLNEVAGSGQKVVMTTQNNNNLLFYLFYTKVNPKTFQDMGSPRERDGLVFNNFTYTYNPCPISGDPKTNALGNTGVIFVNTPDCTLPKNAEILKTIRTPDGLPSFFIIRLNEPIP